MKFWTSNYAETNSDYLELEKAQQNRNFVGLKGAYR